MRRYGLIGRTLKHSFSKGYFTEKFARLQLSDCLYENFEIPSIDRLPVLLAAHPDLQGFNITIPYKEEVLPFLHYKDDVVEEAGACNCVRIVNGKLHGYNTDVTGFRQSLEKNLKPVHSHALVLGTGGAAKAVIVALQQLGIAYQLVSRRSGACTISYDALNEAFIQSHRLVINTTPLGTFPDIATAPDIPYHFLTKDHLLFDLVYNPPKTLFLQKGEEAGASICNGLEMLKLQAEESWKIWND